MHYWCNLSWANQQQSCAHYFLSLWTGQSIIRHCWDDHPLPQDVIDYVNQLTFGDRYGALPDATASVSDEDDNSTYVPPDADSADSDSESYAPNDSAPHDSNPDSNPDSDPDDADDSNSAASNADDDNTENLTMTTLHIMNCLPLILALLHLLTLALPLLSVHLI